GGGEGVGGGRRRGEREERRARGDEQAVGEVGGKARLGEEPREVLERELRRQQRRRRDEDLPRRLERGGDHPGEGEGDEEDERRHRAPERRAPHSFSSRRQRRK